ncbi:MAG: 5-formyltetrahydrofolate cyclo-ligase [Deltaproteobacteria bacterium RIFOXYD12_FULL_57_12]|nr:MAG: 5-formyltetrahydrofolate cyclo-ligase [Deltaproteobacteria bacterium RIFOXYD12_FULL_57_12]
MQGQAEARQKLRQQVLAGRDALSPGERHRKSVRIGAMLWQLPVFLEARILCIYVNFRSEVETLPLIRQCLARGQTVSAPVTVSREVRLIPYALVDPDVDLRPGYCGIPEPDAGRLSAVDPQMIDVVIVPGSVFDAHGGRLGYGGGYYDRFLQNDARRAWRIGLAFETQVVSRVPTLSHDQPVHYLITEERVMAVGGQPGVIA